MAEGIKSMGYQQTLMYGRYTTELGEFARQQAELLKKEEKTKRQKFYDKINPIRYAWFRRIQPYWRRFVEGKDYVLNVIGEDWIFLSILGFVMAFLSFMMDFVVSRCHIAHVWLYHEVEFSVALQFLIWVIYPLVFILFSVGFVHLVAPSAIGSGIPEMKTILRGVVLKEYLTFRTLVSKIVGLCSSIGSGIPIGKEGPFVHVASIVATLLAKGFNSFKGIYENESRNSEMLSAACALGVACTFAAPIGGVLFSIEVTATYFAVRNYWRGFYTAMIGAMTFRLMAIWFQYEETITALLKTHLRHEFPFDPIELLAFAFIGVVCGLAGAMFVYLHRNIIYFSRRHQRLSKFLQKNRFLYPGIVTVVISSLTFPHGLGKFMAGVLKYHEAVDELFSNFTWTGAHMDNLSPDHQEILIHWAPAGSNVYVTLVLYILMHFWMSALANTLPIPAGIFIPVFALGAAFGRLTGECMAAWFPYGVQSGSRLSMIMPGGYAVVGAASMSGAVTHTISTAVIVFELTGQILHVLPAVISVLIANAVCQRLQPSIYDSIIKIKQLPYLPDIQTKGGTSNAHQIYVEDFMIRDVKCISYNSTFQDVDEVLQSSSLRTFPLVDSASSMILLGSVQRVELQRLMDAFVSRDPREIYVDGSEASDPQVQLTTNEIMLKLNKQKVPHKPSPLTLDVPRPKSILKSSTANTPVDTPKSGRKFTFDADHDSDRTSDSESVELLGGFQPRDSLEMLPKHDSPDHSPRNSFRDHSPRQDSPAPDTPDGAEMTAPEISESVDDPDKTHPKEMHKKLRLPADRVVDLTVSEQVRWMNQQMQRVFDYEQCQIDPAPFQLVERTSLYKVHSLFALLSLSHAYVTNTGRLVGVVSLKEVRQAVEGATLRVLEQKKSRKRSTRRFHHRDNDDAAESLTIQINNGSDHVTKS